MMNLNNDKREEGRGKSHELGVMCDL